MSFTEDASIRKFALKLFNDELLTLANLHKRYPKLYKSKRCSLCNIDVENNVHVFICTHGKDVDQLLSLKTKFIKIIIHETANIFKDNVDLNKVKNEIHKFSLNFEKNDVRLMEFNQICFMDIIVGLIPNSLYSIFGKLTKDNASIKRIILNSIRSFKGHLFNLWKKRCEEFVLWEESVNITKKGKKNYKTPKTYMGSRPDNIIEITCYDDIPESDNNVFSFNNNNNITYRDSYKEAVEIAGNWLYAKFTRGLSKFGVACYFKIN